MLIKSFPRCVFEFFNEIMATEVVFDVGAIAKALVYPLATDNGLLIKAVICRSLSFSSECDNTNVSLLAKKATVPSSVGKTAGNLSNCF